MLKRSIDRDPFGLTIEEKIFRNVKRICVGFAVTALTISALDLMNVRTVEAAAEFIHANRLRIADLPQTIRTGIENISFTPSDEPRASVAVLIPRDAIPRDVIARESSIAKLDRPLGTPAAPASATRRTKNKNEPSPVAELAAARHQDAIELAMVTSSSLAPPQAPAAGRLLGRRGAPGCYPARGVDRGRRGAAAGAGRGRRARVGADPARQH